MTANDLDSAELSTQGDYSDRFERTALPLLAPLYRRALRTTKNHADADLNSSRNSVLRCVVNMKGALPQR